MYKKLDKDFTRQKENQLPLNNMRSIINIINPHYVKTSYQKMPSSKQNIAAPTQPLPPPPLPKTPVPPKPKQQENKERCILS
jgi:hypothetical protein